MPKQLKFHVLDEELRNINTTPSTFMDKLFDVSLKMLGSNVRLTLNLEPFVILRGKVLCEDIEEMTNQRFSLTDLIDALYFHFLRKVREATNSELSLFNLTRQIMAHRVDPAELKTYDGSFPSANDLKREELSQLQLDMKRKLVLRGEVFIKDVSLFVEDLDMSIETILEALITDFMRQYCKGEKPAILQEIIEEIE